MADVIALIGMGLLGSALAENLMARASPCADTTWQQPRCAQGVLWRRRGVAALDEERYESSRVRTP
jgi:hypothetical protein